MVGKLFRGMVIFLISAVCIAFFISGAFDLHDGRVGSMAVPLAVLIVAVDLIYFQKRKPKTYPIGTSSGNEIDDEEDRFFALAEEEVDQGRQNKGLWSKALIAANGNESLRKIEYMKLRVAQLKG